MPSRLSAGVTPIVVEVKPRGARSLSPSPSPSPKAVRFAPSSAQIHSRPLTNTEEWSLWNFEHHAAHCRTCFDPHRLYRQKGRLCSEGHALAQDVAINVFCKDNDIYATRKENGKLVRTEIKPGYSHVLGVLKSMDYHLHGASPSPSPGRRPPPVISYDTTHYPVSSARTPRDRSSERQSDRRDKRQSVIIEPASSKPERRSAHRGSRHPSKRYETIVLDDDVEARPSSSSSSSKYKERRGSLYDAEMARLEREKRYRVEVREPESLSARRRRDKDDRRRERYE